MRGLPGPVTPESSEESGNQDTKHAELKYMGSAVMTMEQGALYQPQQIPLHHNEYSLNPEPNNIDQYAAHTHHSSYTNGGAVDHYRRDGTLQPQAPNPFSFTAANQSHGARFVPDRGVASDASSYQPGHNFTDSSSCSISTSPSSGSSSLVPTYTGYQGHHYTAAIPTFPTPVSHPQAFASGSYDSVRVPSLSSGMLPPPYRSPISHAVHASDPNGYASTSSFLARPQLPPHIHTGYQSYSDTSRGLLSGGALSLSSPGAAAYPSHMASNAGYGSSTTDSSVNFPWPDLEVLTADLFCEGQPVTPNVHAKVEKGFFQSSTDQKWTCYRRNYFSVQCSFELHPNIHGGTLMIKRNGKEEERVMAMGMRLAAAVDGSAGKPIELIQHTPKRDAGPKTNVGVVKVSPVPPTSRSEHVLSPHSGYPLGMGSFHATGQIHGITLPLQNLPDQTTTSSGGQTTPQPSSSQSYPYSGSGSAHLVLPGQSTTHQFERVQFKQATANNGKRRASQQYFHLIIELLADVRKDEHSDPVWVKIAQRSSEKIVVRGRSPSHYQNEGNHGSAGRSGSTGGGSGYGGSASTPYGGMNAGAFRSSAAGGYGGSISSASGFRAHGYNLPAGSDHSGSDPESADEGAMDSDPQHIGEFIPTADERSSIQEHPGYQYYPSPIYDGLPQQSSLPPPAKVEGAARFSSDPRQYVVKSEYSDSSSAAQWPVPSCGRFEGVPSSRGYYPTDLSTGYS